MENKYTEEYLKKIIPAMKKKIAGDYLDMPNQPIRYIKKPELKS